MAKRTLAKPRRRDQPPSMGLSVAERAEAWALTGPPGRLWSFGRDVVSALPLLARHWYGRLRGR